MKHRTFHLGHFKTLLRATARCEDELSSWLVDTTAATARAEKDWDDIVACLDYARSEAEELLAVLTEATEFLDQRSRE